MAVVDETRRKLYDNCLSVLVRPGFEVIELFHGIGRCGCQFTMVPYLFKHYDAVMIIIICFIAACIYACSEIIFNVELDEFLWSFVASASHTGIFQ